MKRLIPKTIEFLMHKSMPVFIFFVLLILSNSSVCAGNVRIKNPDSPENFRLLPVPKPVSTAVFLDSQGRNVRIQDFKGKVLVLNVWSTVCAQCVIEMPMLDRLQRDMGGLKFQVIALSVGPETTAQIQRFWANKGIKYLKPYTNNDATFSLAMGVLGLPTTVLIDDQGQEVGRIRGLAEWDSPQIKAQIRSFIKKAKNEEEQRQIADSQKIRPESTLIKQDQPPPPPDRSDEIPENILLWLKK